MTLSTVFKLATVSALALGTAAPVAAQSRCGQSYEFQPGDTLYSVSQSCRVSLARILDLNPSIGNPRDIAVGTDVQLVARSDGSDPAPRQGEQYRVQEGDTLNTIAQAFGVSLLELINANEDADPFALAIGEVLDIPGDQPSGNVSITPNQGTPDTTVTVRASNLRPNDVVTIGAGRQASEWRALRQERVADDGEIRAAVPLPDWADAGDDLIYVVDTDRGMIFKSGVFNVVADSTDRIEVEGRVSSGTECPILTTPDDDTYALTSDGIPFTPGEYIKVEARRADMSFCMEGMSTLNVSDLREIAPPGDDTDTPPLDEAYLRGSWTAKGSDCSRPDFDITRNTAGGLTVETALRGSPRTGYVNQGDDAAFIFDMPRTELPLEARRAQALAVLPPDEGAISMAGMTIEGDGTVFVRCP